MERELLSRKEAADYLRISVAKLDNLRREGVLPRVVLRSQKVGRVLFRIQDLRAFVSERVECKGAKEITCGATKRPDCAVDVP